MGNIFKNKTILVTGGTGTIGSELVRQLLICKPKQIRILSRNEANQYNLFQSLHEPNNVFYRLNHSDNIIKFYIGDIRDLERVRFVTKGVDVVFHAAALKHVLICEYNPFEVVQTNIVGTQNVIKAAVENGVEKVVGISTDKAANPYNVLGISKLMMEKLFINEKHHLGTKTKFSCVRFGNVAWASGSVLPTWKIQADKNGMINVTDRKMTRFLMSIKQAINLTITAAELMYGGEIFVIKMPAIKLVDLAKLFAKKYYPEKKIKINVIGNRGAEKIHEHLLGDNYWSNEILSNNEMFIILPPAHIHGGVRDISLYPGYRLISSVRNYSSDKNIDIKRIAKII